MQLLFFGWTVYIFYLIYEKINTFSSIYCSWGLEQSEPKCRQTAVQTKKDLYSVSQAKQNNKNSMFPTSR